MTKKNYIYVYAIIIVSCIGSFFLGTYFSKVNLGGTKNEQQFNPNNGSQRFMRNAGGDSQKNGDMRGGMQGKFINGDVLSSNDNMITIKTKDGGSKIIFVSGSTKLDKIIIAKTSDISAGSNLTIVGETNQDGSMTASSIQIKQ